MTIPGSIPPGNIPSPPQSPAQSSYRRISKALAGLAGSLLGGHKAERKSSVVTLHDFSEPEWVILKATSTEETPPSNASQPKTAQKLPRVLDVSNLSWEIIFGQKPKAD